MPRRDGTGPAGAGQGKGFGSGGGEEPAWEPEEIVSARNAVRKVPIPGESRATPRNVLNVDP